MAKVTTKSTGTTFVLELDEAEAQYVRAALLKTNPADGSDDTVYDELSAAMNSVGLEFNGSAAQ